MSKINEMRLGFETAYIDGSVVSSSTYRPQFVSNNHKEGKKVLSSIEDELLSCDGFQISVAFITMSGITPLLQTLKELEKRNIKGEILTTNYLNFSEPRALKKLDELSNITLKMYKYFSTDVTTKYKKREWVQKKKDSKLKFSIPNKKNDKKISDDDEVSIRDILASTSGHKTDFMYSVIMNGYVEKIMPEYIDGGLTWLMR